MKAQRFDLFKQIERVEFDTLLFFFGILTAVGALQYIGYLAIVSQSLYGTLGPTYSNILIGLSVISNDCKTLFASVLPFIDCIVILFFFHIEIPIF